MTQTKSAGPGLEGIGTEGAPGAARLSTVLASVPGVAEQSLRATLESLPSIKVVGTAAGCLSAMQMVRAGQVDLVVIDANLPFDDVRAFLRQLRQLGWATYALVLTATNSQVHEALAMGADAALRRDATIGQISTTVDKLGLASVGTEEVRGESLSTARNGENSKGA